MRKDDLDFTEMQNELRALKDLFVEYVESTAQPAAGEAPERSLADTVAMIGLRERIVRTLRAIDELLETVDEIAHAGGMEPFLRAHMPGEANGKPENGWRP